MTFVIAAAGTGGHVYPALAVADSLRARGIPAQSISFLGGDRIEARAVPAAGYRFAGFPLARLRRGFAPSNLTIPSVVRRTARAMAAELTDVGARVVLGMGGYVAVPAAIAARRSGIPFFLQEQNAAPGLASRYAARSAQGAFIGLPGRAEGLPGAQLVGNPLRASIEAFDREALRPGALERYGVHREGPVVGILGGSLGARVLNEAAPALASRLVGCTILHLTGPDPPSLAEASPRAAEWIRRPAEEDMEQFYAVVDLVVCRAGAMTISELAATGTPSVLIPLARVGQRSNAAVLASVGAAVVLDQRDVGAVGDIVQGIIDDSEALVRMSRAARSAAMPGAADLIAAALIEVGGG